jgi:hypothetical protein
VPFGIRWFCETPRPPADADHPVRLADLDGGHHSDHVLSAIPLEFNGVTDLERHADGVALKSDDLANRQFRAE